MAEIRVRGSARQALLGAVLTLVREKGYAATSVDDICRAAGRTKGSFFHHFASKDAIAVAAAEHWAEMTSGFFAEAPYQSIADPLERLLGYVNFRRQILEGELADFTCFVGTMVQETYGTSPTIRDACAASIFGHAEALEPTIAEAMAAHDINAEWSAASLARHMQAVVQGAFILAKAAGGAAVAAESLDHLTRYIRLLFAEPQRGEEP